MIKVVNIVEEGRYGGPQVRIAAVAERLKPHGVETSVIVPAEDTEVFYQRLREKEVRAIRLPLHRLTKDKRHLCKYMASFLPETVALYRKIREEKADVVHCNGAMQIKGVIAGRLAGAKIVWHMNDTSMPLAVRLVFKLLLGWAHAFIFAGNKVLSYYGEGARKKSAIIQAPVDTALFDPAKVHPALPKGRPIIMTVGNINPFKGLEYFIEMAAILNKRYANMTYVIVGSHLKTQTSYLEKLKETVSRLGINNLEFYGEADNVPALLRSADIYVCSSLAEASPISVWEAMAMGKPIVSTDVGDVARYVIDGESGFVVPAGNAAALAEKVGRLIDNETLGKQMGARAREAAVASLDLAICAAEHLKIYQAVMSDQPSAN